MEEVLKILMWHAGWLNLLGQVALTASVDSCLANHIAAMWVIYNGHVFQQEELLLCYGGEASLKRLTFKALSIHAQRTRPITQSSFISFLG